MIVVDASALLEALIGTPSAPLVEAYIFQEDQTVHVPHLLDLEVTQVLRRLVLGGGITVARAQQALGHLANLQPLRYPHEFLLPRVWELRSNVTAYDAVYIALAEHLGAPLLTRDRRMATAAGHHAQIELV